MEVKQKKFLNALNIAFSSNTEAVLKLLAFCSFPEKSYNFNEEQLKGFNLRQETISNFLKRRGEKYCINQK